MNQKGFSAVELMILLAIIGILTVIALPDYYQFSFRARQSEAKTNLGSIFTSQVGYYGEYNGYAGGSNCFKDLEWEPEGDSRYNYYCDDTAKVDCKTKGCAKEPECTKVKSKSSQNGFTNCAAGNLDHDKTNDEWAINDRQKLENTSNDEDH